MRHDTNDAIRKLDGIEQGLRNLHALLAREMMPHRDDRQRIDIALVQVDAMLRGIESWRAGAGREKSRIGRNWT